MQKIAGVWIVLGGLLFGLLACWVKRPNWLTRRRLTIAICCAFLSVALAATYTVYGPFWLHEEESSTDSAPRNWRLTDQQHFEHPDGPAFHADRQGCDSTSGQYEEKALILHLDSCRDYTLQVGYTAHPRTLGDKYFLTADVAYLSGPHDGYCGLLVGWKDNEHYYAFKIGLDTFQVTRDKGGLPHQRVAEPVGPVKINTGKYNRLAVLSEGVNTRFYINGVEVTSLSGLNSISGQTRLAAQAANSSDLITCRFDNVELRVP